MRAARNPYVVWIGAKAVAFAWIAALLFPAIIHMPFGHPMFWVCALAGLLVVATVVDGFRSRKRGTTTDFLVKAVIPIVLLVAAATFSIVTD